MVLRKQIGRFYHNMYYLATMIYNTRKQYTIFAIAQPYYHVLLQSDNWLSLLIKALVVCSDDTIIVCQAYHDSSHLMVSGYDALR